jgi:hypothetical protein
LDLFPRKVQPTKKNGHKLRASSQPVSPKIPPNKKGNNKNKLEGIISATLLGPCPRKVH